MVPERIDQTGQEARYRSVRVEPLIKPKFARAADSFDEFPFGIGTFTASDDEVPWSARVRRHDRIPHARNLVAFARQRFGDQFGERVSVLSGARMAYGGHRLRARSLRLLLQFLEANETWRLPELFVAPNGNVQAQWRSGHCRVVAQFLPEGEVWFTVLERGQLRITGRRTPRDFVAGIGRDAPLAT